MTEPEPEPLLSDEAQASYLRTRARLFASGVLPIPLTDDEVSWLARYDEAKAARVRERERRLRLSASGEIQAG